MSTVAVLSLTGGTRTLVADLDPRCNATAAPDTGPPKWLATPRRPVFPAAGTPSLGRLTRSALVVKPRSKEHDFRVGELRSEFGDLVLDPVLPYRVAVQQAQGACAPIHGLRPARARDLSAAFATLLGHTAKSSP